MLMKPKKDSAITVILANRGKGEKVEKPMTNEMGDEMSYDEEMYKAHAEDILQAFESKDAELLASALKSFVSMCGDSSYSEEEKE